MTSVTISPHARIAALVGVLLIVLAGSAIYLLHGHSTPAAVTTPPAHHDPTPPTKRVHIVPPRIDPLLPAPLRSALERHRFVVVGFYNPHSPVTRRTIAQARAGAADSHVPFVAVNLLNDKVAGPLTALLPAGELLPNPGVAIYERSGTILYRSDSYLREAEVVEAVRESR
jgi:hypothetical protein